MSELLYVYTLVSIVMYVFNCIGFFALFFRNRKETMLWGGILFMLYVLDISVLLAVSLFPRFQDSFLSPGVYKIMYKILATSMVFVYRRISMSFFDRRMKTSEYIFWAALMTANVLTVFIVNSAVPSIVLKLIHMLLIVLIVCGMFREYRGRRGELSGSSRGFITAVLIVSAAFFVSLVGEAVYSLCTTSDIGMRSLATELFSIACSVIGIVYIISSVRSVPEDEGQERFVSVLQRLAEHYSLTKRETEILALLMQGHSNRYISEAAYISIGTVKVHAHNIFRKLDIADRTEINRAIERIDRNK